jgi:hypothetical protein
MEISPSGSFKTFQALKQRIVDDDMRNAFQMFEFEFQTTQTTQTPYRWLVREGKLGQYQGLREIFAADYPVDRPSKRPRETQCEWADQDDEPE